jgi:hypothetical protein
VWETKGGPGSTGRINGGRILIRGAAGQSMKAGGISYWTRAAGIGTNALVTLAVHRDIAAPVLQLPRTYSIISEPEEMALWQIAGGGRALSQALRAEMQERFQVALMAAGRRVGGGGGRCRSARIIRRY